jgi:hypothetical protein
MAAEIAAKKDGFGALFKRNFAAITIATVMRPLQDDLQFSAAKHTSITHAAAAARNLDAATPLRFAKTN